MVSITPVLQTEAAECGLACLAMAANFHGQSWSLRDLRRRFSVSLKGLTLTQLIAIARQLGLQGRPLRLDAASVTKLKLPCILHWNLNHFVVMTKVDRSHVTLIDPAYGQRHLRHAEFSNHFTGVALELAPTAEFKPLRAIPRVSIRQLTGRIEGLWSSLALLLIFSMVLQLFAIMAPFFMQWAVDQALVSADHELLTLLGLGFSLVLLLQVLTGFIRGWLVVYLSNRLGMQWQGNVFSHMIRLPMDFYEKRHLGDVAARMASVQDIQRTMTTSFVEAVIDGLMALVTFAMMLTYSTRLAAVTLLAALLYLGMRTLAYRPLRNGTEQALIAGARQDSHLLESIRGMQSIKVAGGESVRQAAYLNLLNETANRNAWTAKLNLGFGLANQLVFGLERVIVIWLGVLLAMQNVFSVGMLIAYIAYKEQFAQRIAALVDKSVEFRMLRLYGERLADIVLTEPEYAGEDAEPPVPQDTRLEVKDLCFRYGDAEPWVLESCSLVVNDGESVAIVGASGCGKTTLTKLMLGLLRPYQGTVTIGAQDIFANGAHVYRRGIGAVLQDDQLFAGNIAENIAFGEDHFDAARIEIAAHQAAVHDEICAMPMGYNTLIGDMGTALSGGQKQRVILARALYRQPRILFLDEATSHLDGVSERAISEALRKLKLTKVIIAHRRETIASVDRVLVMDGGRIVREFKPTQYDWQNHEALMPNGAVDHAVGFT